MGAAAPTNLRRGLDQALDFPQTHNAALVVAYGPLEFRDMLYLFADGKVEYEMAERMPKALDTLTMVPGRR